MTSAWIHRREIHSGRRLAVKDSIDVAGLATRMGSKAFADSPPAINDADVVAALVDAGWKLAGKTRLHGLALGATGINDYAGTPTNPFFPDLVPGGSSSGSAAAVAANEADLAIGTDTGGSVRVPAACCGVLGIKTSFGAISRRGVQPARSSLDVVGFFSRSSDILIEALAATATGIDEAAPLRRLGRIRTQGDQMIEASVNAALESTTYEVETIEWPGITDAFKAGLIIINVEAWQSFGKLAEAGLLPDDVAERLFAGRAIAPEVLAIAQHARQKARNEIDALLMHFDALALPALPMFPPTLAQGAKDASGVSLTLHARPFNVTGHPAISIPLVPTAEGPISLQLVGRYGADASLCAAATQFYQKDQ